MTSSGTPTEPTARPVGPLTGTIMDRYTLSRRVGSGAFGSVWMARDERLQRDVAVKILPRELVSDGRFEREARAAARLSHPGIVTLYEASVDDDGAYLVSELVDGFTLGRLLADGALSDQDILRIGLALCDALDHAHRQGVVHRDVKPSNVLVPSGGADRRGRAGSGSRGQAAKLTDFGVARVIDADSLTLSGDVIGTLNYMAPEQARGLEASEPADLFSLAIVLYEALTGINPLRSGSAGAVGRRRQLVVLPQLRRQRRDLPASLGDAIDRALRPQPHDRGTIADLRFGLERALPVVGDEPGTVADWALRRSSDDGPAEPLVWRRLSGTAPAAAPGGPPDADGRPGRADRAARAAPRTAGSWWAGTGADPDRLFWQRRAAAAACAAAAAAWIGADVLTTTPPPIALLALVAGALTLALPRIGWLATVSFACATLAIGGDHGVALVVAIAAAAPILALPLTPTAWPLAAVAPALGLLAPVGAAGAWPALAGIARTPWRRAALAASGWLWLLAAAVLQRPQARVGHLLYLPNPRPLPARAAWSGSVQQTIHQLLAPYVHTGALLGAAAWALAAVLAPVALKARSRLGLGLSITVWSTLTVAMTAVAVTIVGRSPAAALHGSQRLPSTGALVFGAVIGGIVLLALAAIRARSSAGRPRGYAGEAP